MHFVKINRDRGYGVGMFRIVGESSPETYKLKDVRTNEYFTLYKDHTFRDAETIRADAAERDRIRTNASQIGIRSQQARASGLRK